LSIRIAIYGDFDAAMPTHQPFLRELPGVDARWISTLEPLDVPAYDGILLAPGSPYSSFTNALDAIRQARHSATPFLGICGGFQHALIEWARHELALADADSAEHGTPSANLVITPLACRLDGQHTVEILPGTKLAALYAPATQAHETYFCGFGASATYEEPFAKSGLVINARAADGAPRGCEWPAHPFFLATAFQPQMRPGHPLLQAFVNAARLHALKRTWAAITPADYRAHMNNTGQAAINAALSADLLTPFTGGRLLVAGAGPGQMFDHGLTLSRFAVTLNDISADFLAEAQRRLPHARTLLADLTRDALPPHDLALVVLVLEHLDWRRALHTLADCAPQWLVVIQRNPPGQAAAVTPGVEPPGSMRSLARAVPPHLVDENTLSTAAAQLGYRLLTRQERPAPNGKAMIGLHYCRAAG
jgi:hypothetical protein